MGSKTSRCTGGSKWVNMKVEWIEETCLNSPDLNLETRYSDSILQCGVHAEQEVKSNAKIALASSP